MTVEPVKIYCNGQLAEVVFLQIGTARTKALKKGMGLCTNCMRPVKVAWFDNE